MAGMDVPRLLAIDDVRLTAPVIVRDKLRTFYTDLLGFDCLTTDMEGEGPAELLFRGYPRSGPKLVIVLGGKPPETSLGRRLLVQVCSLAAYAEEMGQRRIRFAWSSGVSFFDRRLLALDPAGNWVELVVSHPW